MPIAVTVLAKCAGPLYALPIVVWYNSSLPWQGVLFMDGALILWGWAFAAFLKAFVFY